MRKLKNLELVGKTRLIPGVGHVKFEEEVPEHVAVACEAAGLDWCSPPTESPLTESPLAESPLAPGGGTDGGGAGGPDRYREVIGGLDTGDALRPLDKLEAGGAQGDNGGEDGNVSEDTNIGVKSVTRKRK